MNAPVYELTGVEHRYGGRIALSCERLVVRPGRIVGIKGPNGAGKSTLLAVMAFLAAPTRGSVRFMGEETAGSTDVRLRRQAVLMPQDPALLRRKVRENVLYGLKVRGVSGGRAAEEALELVGLDPALYLDRWWWELSGGEARRVALAARLALDPKVLLLDEPTASLDPESAGLVLAALRSARDGGLTVVAVSHDSEWLESASDDMYRLDPREGINPVRLENVQCAP